MTSPARRNGECPEMPASVRKWHEDAPVFDDDDAPVRGERFASIQPVQQKTKRPNGNDVTPLSTLDPITPPVPSLHGECELIGLRCGVRLGAPRGKGCVVIGYALETPEAPFLFDEANIGKATVRAGLRASAPEELRDEFGGLLERAALRWIARASTPHGVSGGQQQAPPYPPVELAAEPQDGAVLFTAIRETLRRYVWIGASELDFLALWVLHTYALEVAEHTPYTHIHAPTKQCGKSTLLDVLAGLVAKGVRVSNLSASFLFRVLDQDSPTLLIDEVTAWLSGPNTGELRGILNDGFQRSGRVGRVESSSKGGGKEFHPTYFKVWGAKAFSGIGRELSDELLDRCVPIRLARAGDAERATLVKLRDRSYRREAAPLRARCARWVADTLPTLRTACPALPATLSGRQQDIWEPLLAIADAINPEVGARARYAALTLHDRQTLGPGEQLLADLLEIFAETSPLSEFLATDHLLGRLVDRDDRPWCEMPGSHRPLTARGLSSILKRFDIEHSRPRGDGKRGYHVAAFGPAWHQYLSDPEAKRKLSTLPISGTSGTSGTLNAPDVPDVPDVPHNGRHDGNSLQLTGSGGVIDLGSIEEVA